MDINSTLRTLEMEGYSQFTNQYILSVSLLLNAMSKRAANITGFKDASRKVSSFETTKELLITKVLQNLEITCCCQRLWSFCCRIT